MAGSTKVRRLLRALLGRRYPRSVAPSRKLPPVQPVPHLAELDAYVKSWVAVKDGKVVAAAATSAEVAEILFRKDIHGAIIQYVPEPSKVEKVGLG